MSLRAPRRIATILAVPTVLAAGVALVAPLAQAAPTKHEANYKGSAFAVSAKVQLGGADLLDEILPSIVEFPEGGTDNLLELPTDLEDVVTLKVLDVGSELNDEDPATLVSTASVANLGVLGELVGADVLTSRCTAKDTDAEGDSQVANLTIGGMKIPVDAGPNAEVEIPEQFASFLSGGITIDERNELDDGGVQIRALHINLVVAPEALEEALASVSATVRAAAESAKTALEAATGQSLDSLLGEVGGAEPDAEPAAEPKAEAKADKAGQKNGAEAVERADVRADAATPQSATETQGATDTQAPAQTEDAADSNAPNRAGDAAIDRDAAAPQAAEAQEAQSEAAAQDAELDPRSEYAETQAEAQSDAAAEDAALDPRSEYAQQQADGADSAAAGADAASPEVAADEATAADQAAVAEQANQQAQVRESARAEDGAKSKRDGASLSAPDRAAEPAVPAVDDEIAGALGIDVIISQVECTGAERPKVVVQETEPKKEALPKSGGDGALSGNLALAGLGLLAAGGSAVYLTRRRGKHAV